MLISGACVAAGIMYAGLKTLIRQRSQRKAARIITQNGQANQTSSPVIEEDRHQEIEVQLSRACAISSIAVGLSIVSAFGYPLFGVLSAPLTVYGAIPAFEQASAAMLTENRKYMSVVWSAVVIGSLATGRFFSAAVLTWLDDFVVLWSNRLSLFNKLIVGELEHRYQLLTQLYGVKPASVWVLVDDVGLEIPFSELQVGDTVVMSTKEVIPVRGTVVDGTARVVRWRPGGNGQPENKEIGDQVTASTLILSGSIKVQVESL